MLGIQLTHQLNRQTMGIDEVAIHEQVANAPLQNQGAQKGLEVLHGAAIGNPLMSREAKFMEGKAQLGDAGPPGLQMVGEPREERTKGPHQHQHRALNRHFSHARLPPRGQVTLKPWRTRTVETDTLSPASPVAENSSPPGRRPGRFL